MRSVLALVVVLAVAPFAAAFGLCLLAAKGVER